MRVMVVRSGGFTGVERHGEGDTAGDPVLRALVAETDLNSLPTRAGPAPDEFVYEITIGDTTVEAGETQLTDPLRTLVKHVLG